MSVTYQLNTDAFSGEVTHVLEKDRLVITYAKSGRTESVPLASIREINVRQEMQDVFSVLVYRNDGGKTFRITSRHFRGIGQFEDRRREYSPFVRALLTSTASANGGARFTAGSSVLYALGWIVLVIAIACSALLAVAVVTRGLPPLRLLFVLPVAFFMAFGFIRQGRARVIDPASPPPELIP